jgi:hypothetical protein
VDLRQVIEPQRQVLALLAIKQPLVELLGPQEPAYFAISSHITPFGAL